MVASLIVCMKKTHIVNTGKSLTEKLDDWIQISMPSIVIEIFFGKDGLFVGSVLKDLLEL